MYYYTTVFRISKTFVFFLFSKMSASSIGLQETTSKTQTHQCAQNTMWVVLSSFLTRPWETEIERASEHFLNTATYTFFAHEFFLKNKSKILMAPNFQHKHKNSLSCAGGCFNSHYHLALPSRWFVAFWVRSFAANALSFEMLWISQVLGGSVNK